MSELREHPAPAPPAESETDAALYARVAPELTRFATALVGRADAADVVSTAVMKSLSTPAWPDVVNKRAYLFRAVFNESKRLHGRSARRRERERATDTRPHWDLPNLRPDVRAAALRLSTQQRAVITLTYWADLSPAAIAEHLGISEGSVRRHLARAREQLRRTLHDDD